MQYVPKKWWARILVAGCLLILASWAITIIQMEINYTRSLAEGKIIVDALRSRYPGLRFEGGGGHAEGGYVGLRIGGIRDPARRAQMRDWLIGLKAEKGLRSPIWLWWNHDDGSEAYDVNEALKF